MAIGMKLDIPGGTKEQYDQLNQAAFGSTDGPTDPIPGLIIHTAGATADGWRIFDVWESKEAFEQFMNDVIMPATEGLGMPEIPPEVYELAAIYGSAVPA